MCIRDRNEYRKKRKLYEEIAEIFTTDGYTAEMEKKGKGCRITKGEKAQVTGTDTTTMMKVFFKAPRKMGSVNSSL